MTFGDVMAKTTGEEPSGGGARYSFMRCGNINPRSIQRRSAIVKPTLTGSGAGTRGPRSRSATGGDGHVVVRREAEPERPPWRQSWSSDDQVARFGGVASGVGRTRGSATARDPNTLTGCSPAPLMGIAVTDPGRVVSVGGSTCR